MQTIYKYQIPILGYFKLYLPKNAKILKVAEQKNNDYVWAEIDTDAEWEFRHFWRVGTGYKLDTKPIKKDYIGSWQNKRQTLIWHLFEVNKNPYGRQ